MANIILRRANEYDYAGVYAVRTEAHSVHYTRANLSLSPYEYRNALFNNSYVTTYVALDDKKVVGVGTILKYKTNKKQGIGRVNVTVSRKYLKKGIGGAMLEILHKVSAKEGLRMLEAHIQQDNDAGKALVSKFNYTLCGEIEDALADANGVNNELIYIRKL